MNLKLPKDWGLLHHAYLISGTTTSEVWYFLESIGFIKQANPDALSLEIETFGIDEARSLFLWASKKSFGERKVSVISSNNFTLEAQNALLKLFEEPPTNTYFFVLLENIGIVISTLISRVHILEVDLEKNLEKEIGETFLKSDLSERFKIINPIIKNKDKEEVRKLIWSLAGKIKKII